MTFVSDDIDNAFHSKLEECENRQRELQSIRLALEKEISVKKTSISIDRDRCLRYDDNPCNAEFAAFNENISRERTCFPSTNHLSGYRTAPFGMEQT